MNDRFATAVGQLGNELPHVRVGAVYALESVARDASDHAQPIIDLLAAFIRSEAPAPEDNAMDPDLKPLKNRAPDLQAALTVLCRAPLCRRRVDDFMGAPYPADGEHTAALNLLDLSRTDLRIADLKHAKLQGVDLHYARLEGADLTEAHLERANLRNACVGLVGPERSGRRHGTNFTNAYLQDADLISIKGLDKAYGFESAHR